MLFIVGRNWVPDVEWFCLVHMMKSVISEVDIIVMTGMEPATLHQPEGSSNPCVRQAYPNAVRPTLSAKL